MKKFFLIVLIVFWFDGCGSDKKPIDNKKNIINKVAISDKNKTNDIPLQIKNIKDINISKYRIINHPPIWSMRKFNIVVDENKINVVQLKARDRDKDKLKYYINKGNSDMFDINSSTGVIIFKTAPDYEKDNKRYRFRVYATDGNNTISHNMIIYIKNINDNSPAWDMDSFGISILENQTKALTLKAIDDDHDTLSYAISGVDADSFDINTKTGKIVFKQLPDFETKKEYIFNASVSDKKYTISHKIIIDIIDIYETSNLYIKMAVYDNRQTTSVDDDILYIYFNKDIKSKSINKNINTNYKIYGIGAIGSASTGSYDNTFYRYKVLLKSGKTKSIAFDTLGKTKIILRPNQIKDTKGYYPDKNHKTTIRGISNVFVKLKISRSDKKSMINKSYTRDDKKEIVKDNITDLMWQDNSNIKNNEQNYSSAKKYCSSLTLGRYEDWRLPNIDELKSIVDYNKHEPSANPIFENIKSYRYWSSSSNISNLNNNWYIYFDNGNTDYLYDKAHICCVRGNRFISRHSFVRDDKKEVVLDMATNLMWQDNIDALKITKTWSSAKKYCSNLTLGRYKDWRLPNINELYYLANKKKNKPIVSLIFQNIILDYYWSSTTLNTNSKSAWGILFSSGRDYWDKKSYLYHVRCIRDN